METDWTENRAKIKQDPIRNLLGALSTELTPPASATSSGRAWNAARSQHNRNLHNHRGAAEVYVNQYRDSTVWQPRPRTRAWSGVSAPADGPLRAEDARARAQLAASKDDGRRRSYRLTAEWQTRARRTIRPRLERVGLVLDRVASPSKTATARRVSISCATSIRRRRARQE